MAGVRVRVTGLPGTGRIYDGREHLVGAVIEIAEWYVAREWIAKDWAVPADETPAPKRASK